MTQGDLGKGNERTVVVRSEGGGKNRALRPEQQRMSCMEDIINKFSKGGQPDVAPCAETLLVVKACTMLQKY